MLTHTIFLLITCSCARFVGNNKISAGNMNTCVILPSGDVKCWGSNDQGVLGYGDRNSRGRDSDDMGENLPIVDLGTGRTALEIHVEKAHACAVLDDHTAKCWGHNSYGENGQGDRVTRGDGPNEMGDDLPIVDLGAGRTVQSMCVANHWSCFVLDDGNLKCIGYGGNGCLGYGDSMIRGTSPSHMGDNLPNVDLGTGRTATQVGCTKDHTCVLLDNGMVKCFGSNHPYGQLGQGHGSIWVGKDSGDMGDNLPAVDLGTGRYAVDLEVGHKTTCAILDDGSMKCWGYNGNGKLGIGSHASYKGRSRSHMGDNLPAINLGTGRSAVHMAVGWRHVCAILDNGDVKCWGKGGYGQLGSGDNQNRGHSAGTMGDNLPTVDLGTGRTALQLAASDDYTCALLDDYTVKCWGYVNFGLPTLESQRWFVGRNANEMGDNLPAIDLGPIQVATQAPSQAPTQAPTAREFVLRIKGFHGSPEEAMVQHVQAPEQSRLLVDRYTFTQTDKED